MKAKRIGALDGPLGLGLEYSKLANSTGRGSIINGTIHPFSDLRGRKESIRLTKAPV